MNEPREQPPADEHPVHSAQVLEPSCASDGSKTRIGRMQTASLNFIQDLKGCAERLASSPQTLIDEQKSREEKTSQEKGT